MYGIWLKSGHGRVYYMRGENMASITLRKAVAPFESMPVQSYDMVVEVLSAQGMPKEIFVFQHGIAPPYTGAEPPTDYFVSIADPVDLEDYPPEAPNMENWNPFYRTATATLRFRSLQDLEETWEFMQQDVRGLVDALNTGVTGGSSEDVIFN
jgi:hypothetical protein